MRIAIASDGDTLESPVSARFGRARNFLIVDTDTGAVEVVANEQNLNAAQGAGIQSAQTVAQAEPEAVIAGHCGPKAFVALSAAEIPVYVNVTGSVAEAVERLKLGKLKPTRQADVDGHWA